MSDLTKLTTYASAFMASISLFSLVDVGRVDGSGHVAAAITQVFLLPILGLTTASFLAATIIVLSRSYLRRPHRWNSDRAEHVVLEVGLATAAYFGLLALISYVLALFAPAWLTGAGPAMARFWPWFLALPCLLFGALGPRHKPAWLVAGALFVTVGLFTG